MPGVKLSYDVTNKLAEHIRMKQAKRMLDNGGYPVTLRSIEKELADYCRLTLHTITAYKHSKATPSLPVALKIARYFGVDVTEIYPLDDPEDFDF